MIVVDTNLVAALLLQSSARDRAEAVFARDPRWAAPRLWRSELRNVLVRAVRLARMPLAAAELACAQAHALLQGREHDVEDAAVLRRATESGCTSYDCEFVALAEGLAVPLVTFDRQVLEAFPATAIHPERFGSGAFWGDRVSEAVARFAPGTMKRPTVAGRREGTRKELTGRGRERHGHAAWLPSLSGFSTR